MSDIIRTVGSGVTILVALSTLVWFVANLDGRVKRLEEQVHTLNVAPVIADASKTTSPPAALTGAVQNPIAETCAKLAMEAKDSIKAGHQLTEAQPIQEMMQKLGCISK